MTDSPRCFICHNMRFERIGSAFFSLENEALKLTKRIMKWRKFDGTECEQEIYECEDCKNMDF